MTAVGVVWAARERLLLSVDDDSADQVTDKLKDESSSLIEKLQGEGKGEKEIQAAYDLDSKVEQYFLQQQAGNLSKKNTNWRYNVKDKLSSVSAAIGVSKTSQDTTVKKQLDPEQSSSSSEQAPAKPLMMRRLSMSMFKNHGPKDNTGNIQLLETSHDSGDTEKKDPVHVPTGDGQQEQEKVPVTTGGGQLPSSSVSSATDFLSDVCTFKKTIVGMDADIETAKKLVNGKSQFMWIYGKHGVGKTTLARNLFENSSELKQFNGRAWAQVGQKFQARDVAAIILLQLSYMVISNEDIQAMATTELMEQLQNAQKNRTCLVVLDDVPSMQAWKTILSALPLQPDTRVIITACLTEEEVRLIPDNSEKLFREPLNEKHSWELLVKQLSKEDRLVVKDQKQTEEVENIKKNILTRCGGIPLAITVFGGAIRGKFHNLLPGGKADLLEFLETPGENLSPESDKILNEVLCFSYRQLPYLLKSCFLCLSLFRDNQFIPVEKLYFMWMAEGVLKTDQVKKSRMDIAEEYLKALVQRGLVMVRQEEDSEGLGKIKSCKLHPVVHRHSIEEGQKEGFYRLEGRIQGSAEAVSDTRKDKSYTKRRIAIDIENLQQCLKNDEQNHIRALLFFMTTGNTGEPADLKDFKSAKFLDFDGVDFSSGKVPKSIDKLVYLRHLSFRGCQLQDFPQSLCKFSFLETLDLLVRSSGKMTIANSLGTMSSLLHLYLPLSFTTTESGKKLELSGLTKLETLENFHAGVCDVSHLEFLGNLQIFKGIADGDSVDVEKMVNEMIRFSNGKALRWSISLRNFESYSTARSDIVKDLLMSESLQSLEIEGYLGELPADDKDHKTGIADVIFNGSEFYKDPMQILGHFQHLRNLVLCNDAFDGKKMVCAKGSFPKLISLKLSSLWSLEELIVDDGAMRCLTSLVIEHCRKFKDYNFEKIPSLRDIKIDMTTGK